MNLAIIPARGGSKGIPRKNLSLLAGRPLISYTIEAARHARGVQRVLVSTDDAEIAAVSQQYGAEIIWRPSDLSGDTASSESAILHALRLLEERERTTPDLVVFLQCTSPLTLSDDIDCTVQALHDGNADSALAVTPFHYFLWREDDEGNAVGINHDKRERLLRQQREPQYRETGSVYVMRTKGFLQAKHRFFGKTAMYVMPPKRCLEIDDPVDLQIAEVFLREREQHRRLELLPSSVDALVLDFDGIFTDNRVLVLEDGREAVFCHRGDGWGLSQLKRFGIPVLVISSEQNPVVQARCHKLGIPCLHNVRDKLETLTAWGKERNLNLSRMVYLGNDVNDLPCLQSVGCGVVVKDAHPEARVAARIVLHARGGEGAVREMADLIAVKLEEA